MKGQPAAVLAAHEPGGRLEEILQLLGQNAALLPLVALSAVLALVMQIVMARMLGPSEFAIVASLLGLMFVLAILSASIQVDVARSVASIGAMEGPEPATRYAARALSSVAVVAAGLSIVMLVISVPVSKFLHFGSPGAMLAMSSVTVTALCLPVLRGRLQGKQRFLSLGFNMVFEAVVRLGCGVLLVALGLGASGAILAYGLAGAVTLAVLLPPLLQTRLPRAPAVTGRVSMVWPIFLTNLALVLMASLDVLVAKRFLDNDAAGSYAGMALLGRAVLFATGSIPLVMLPRTAEAHVMERDPLPAFQVSGVLVLIAGGAAVALYGLAPKAVVHAVLGSDFIPERTVLLMLGGAGGIVGMLLVYANLYFARGDRWIWVAPTAALCVELGLFTFNHGSAEAIALDVVVPASALLALLTATTYVRRRELFPRPRSM